MNKKLFLSIFFFPLLTFAEDNLSSTLNSLRDEIKSVSKTINQLDKVKESAKKIEFLDKVIQDGKDIQEKAENAKKIISEQDDEPRWRLKEIREEVKEMAQESEDLWQSIKRYKDFPSRVDKAIEFLKKTLERAKKIKSEEYIKRLEDLQKKIDSFKSLKESTSDAEDIYNEIKDLSGQVQQADKVSDAVRDRAIALTKLYFLRNIINNDDLINNDLPKATIGLFNINLDIMSISSKLVDESGKRNKPA